MLMLQGLGGVLRYGVLPAPDLTFVAKYPMSGNWPHNGYSKEVGADVASAAWKFCLAWNPCLASKQKKQLRASTSLDVVGFHC
jgi:hypothetical protein